MEFIDTHSHLYLEEFEGDIDEVISNALLNKVNKIVLPNIDSTTLPPLLKLHEKYPEECYPCIGLHPTSVKENYKEELNFLEKKIQSNKYIAIGETGIDLYWDKTFFKQQCDSFLVQLDMAKSLSLPIIIHCRESFNEIMPLLEKKAGNGLTGIFHSFPGTNEQAMRVIELGFKIGINGVVTFKNSHLPEVVKSIPLNEMVLETDAPFLTPVPKRGKRNESSYLIYIAQKIAEIRNEPLEEIAQITTQNALKLFNFNKYKL
jgi:TatD DNase family protein